MLYRTEIVSTPQIPSMLCVELSKRSADKQAQYNFWF